MSLNRLKKGTYNANAIYGYIALLLCLFTSKVMSKEALKAATLDYPPYEYLENGETKGIAIELIAQVLKRIETRSEVKSVPKTIDFNFYPWRRAVNSVEQGKSDLLFNAGKNEERQKWGNYVESTLIMQNYVLFKRKASSFEINASFDNVYNLPIAVRTGFLYGTGLFRGALDRGQFSYIV